MHAVYDDPMIGPLIIILPLVVSKFRLIRFRSHYGKFILAGSVCAVVFGACQRLQNETSVLLIYSFLLYHVCKHAI